MKRFILVVCFLLSSVLLGAEVRQSKDLVFVNTKNISLILRVRSVGGLSHLYMGENNPSITAETLTAAGSMNQHAYPVYGQGGIRESSLAVTHPDGNMTLQSAVQSVDISESADASVDTITMKDDIYDFMVKVCCKAFKDVDMIEAWTEITNNEKKAVTLRNFPDIPAMYSAFMQNKR